MRIFRKSEGDRGVTLIELAVVMAIIAIMAVFMAPAIGEWLDNYRIRQAAREISSDFQFSKMKAISSNLRRYCTITFNITVAGTNFDYIVYPDYNNNLQLDGNVGDLDGDGVQENETNEIFKSVRLNDSFRNVAFDTSQAGGDGITLINNGNSQPSVAFDPAGFPRDNSGRLVNQQSIFIKNTKNNKRRQITISTTGRIGINEY